MQRWAVVCLVAAILCVVGTTSAEVQRIRMRMRAKEVARLRSDAESESMSGSLATEGMGMLTQNELDSDSDPSDPQPQMTARQKRQAERRAARQKAAEAKKKAEEEKKKAAEERKKTAEEEKKKQAEEAAKKKAAREQKRKEREAKRKAEREQKRKEREAKRKERERKRKEKEAKRTQKKNSRKNKKKKQRNAKNKVLLSCARDPVTNELKCQEMEKPKPDASPEEKLRRRKIKRMQNGQPQITFSDHDSGTWKQIAPNPWPPHNLNIKSFILTGIGATNIKCVRANGGFGLPNPSPLVLKFALGWDTHLHHLIEKHKDREEVSGVLYYVAGNGKAVAKLTFEKAVIASIKWSKLERSGPKSDKPAMVQVILQPASSTVERIERVRDAPAAPEADLDHLHQVTRKDFHLDIEGLNSTDAVVRVTLPSIVMNMRRKTSFGWDAETKQQKRSVTYKVIGIKHKHLYVRLPRGTGSIKAWREWFTEPQKRPRSGTIEITQPEPLGGDDDAPAAADGETPQKVPLYSMKFFGLYPNRISKSKDFADVELSFDKMLIEHFDPE